MNWNDLAHEKTRERNKKFLGSIKYMEFVE